MAKGSGKKIGNQVQDAAGRSTAKKYFKKLKNNKSTDVVYSAESRVLAPVVKAQITEEFSGFIFMCNGKTKPECYINRVFGLPCGKREVVEKIKTGMKLFLFDFDVKFLYGVYEATSNGGMNLEPAAFGEKFPAQVRFRIYKDCLPLHLNSFRTAIKDNYHGSKFAPELNGQQVRNLLSLFKPIVVPSPASLRPYGAPQLRMPPPPINVQLNSPLTPPLRNPYRPYLAGPMHSLPAQQVMGSEPVKPNVLNPHLQHLYSAPRNPYPFAETRQPVYSNNVPQTMQESYPRYTTIPEMYPHGRPVGLEVGYNGSAIQTQREPLPNHADNYGYHNFRSMPTAAHDYSHVNTPPCYSGSNTSHVNTPPSYISPGSSLVNTPLSYNGSNSSHVNTPPCYISPDPSHVNIPPCYISPDPSHVNTPPCYISPDPSHVNTPPCYSGPTYGLPQPPPPSGSMTVASYYSYAAPVPIQR